MSTAMLTREARDMVVWSLLTAPRGQDHDPVMAAALAVLFRADDVFVCLSTEPPGEGLEAIGGRSDRDNFRDLK